MGIRYYAYAFDPDLTEWALADPRSFLSADPLADAWGLEPGAAVSIATFRQTLPDSEMLYLDNLQAEVDRLRADAPARRADLAESHQVEHG